MLVCHCNGITDREIRRLARSREGSPSGATVVAEALSVGRRCGAGQGCGGCVERIVQIVSEERLESARDADPVLAAG